MPTSSGTAAPSSAAPVAAQREAVRIEPVRTRRELSAFIRLPWRLYKDAPLWVPPLISERRKHLSRKHNPFFEHAEAEYFLAWRGKEPVGRISAQIDHRLDEAQGEPWGLFGFFECEDDEETARALLGAAEEWLRARGRPFARGPFDFTTNHECGLLVEGHGLRPQVLENWHHPYYQQLLTAHGYDKEVDLLKWQILTAEFHRVNPAIYELAEKLEEEHGITIRNMRRRDFQEEVRRFMDVYNTAWQSNWGFVPLTDHELEDFARQLRPLLDERWAYAAETRGGTTAGAALSLPDYNFVLSAIGNGRLLPFGWIRALLARRKIREIRVFALGVKKEFRHTGTAAGLYARTWDTMRSEGIHRIETGWILESNEPMNRAMVALGGDVVKRYRIFGKRLAAD
jgi:hypothetical protein